MFTPSQAVNTGWQAGGACAHLDTTTIQRALLLSLSPFDGERVGVRGRVTWFRGELFLPLPVGGRGKAASDNPQCHGGRTVLVRYALANPLDRE